MSKIRAKFMRGEQAKYISHLDLLRTFERSLRRVKLPIAYSKGFNPHPDIVFGLPLSVGVTSDSEYADFGLDSDISSEEFLERLNLGLPEGLKIIAAQKITDGKNIMAIINKASYSVTLVKTRDDLKEKVDLFLAQKEIMADKKTKSGIKRLDIKPMIFALEVEDGEDICLKMKVSAGNNTNLNPQVLVAALGEFVSGGFKILRIHRTELEVE